MNSVTIIRPNTLAKKTLQARSEWNTLATLLGYRLLGWTFDIAATLVRPNGTTLELTRQDRLAILSLLGRKNAKSSSSS